MRPLFIHGQAAARELVIALGLDPDKSIIDLSFKVPVNGVAEVIVTYAMTTDQLEVAAVHLRKFNLVEKQELPSEPSVRFREFT